MVRVKGRTDGNRDPFSGEEAGKHRLPVQRAAPLAGSFPFFPF
ncbi:hypothetical protein B4135_0875 [Caldibacillus debilis]|uniref:Uncharacterized protein n=1 Tax=Caldibacillus debilis TaxID=301148 RepID=A0A150M6G2_9BACI|nr:hypothetical protein B4135_0875 [Caldibacillus debilis]